VCVAAMAAFDAPSMPSSSKPSSLTLSLTDSGAAFAAPAVGATDSFSSAIAVNWSPVPVAQTPSDDSGPPVEAKQKILAAAIVEEYYVPQ